MSEATDSGEAPADAEAEEDGAKSSYIQDISDDYFEGETTDGFPIGTALIAEYDLAAHEQASANYEAEHGHVTGAPVNGYVYGERIDEEAAEEKYGPEFANQIRKEQEGLEDYQKNPTRAEEQGAEPSPNNLNQDKKYDGETSLDYDVSTGKYEITDELETGEADDDYLNAFENDEQKEVEKIYGIDPDTDRPMGEQELNGYIKSRYTEKGHHKGSIQALLEDLPELREFNPEVDNKPEAKGFFKKAEKLWEIVNDALTDFPAGLDILGYRMMPEHAESVNAENDRIIKTLENCAEKGLTAPPVAIYFHGSDTGKADQKIQKAAKNLGLMVFAGEYKWEKGYEAGIKEEIKQIKELSQKAGAPVRVIGWSQGGMQAISVARRGEVKREVESFTMYGAPVNGVRKGLQGSVLNPYEDMKGNVKEQTTGSEEMEANIKERITSKPLKIVMGSEDRITPTDFLDKGRSGAQISVLDGAGHITPIMNEDEALIAILSQAFPEEFYKARSLKEAEEDMKLAA